MKRGFFALTMVLALGLVISCQSSASGKPAAPSYGIDHDINLHTKWPFMVGVAVPGRAFHTGSDQYDLLRHFEVLVAENDMKPDAVLPANGTGPYRWDNADRMVKYAEENNIKMRGHTLIWHSQTPAWFFNGNGKEGRATKDQLYQRMENLIKTVFEKYGGKIGWWDVVNEPIGDGGGPRPANSSKFTAIMEDSGLTGIDRYEYVLRAFQWARRYADANGGRDVKLYLNEYNIEYGGNKQQELIRMINWLLENDAPIDGVGLQSHIKWDNPDVSQFATAIDRFSAIKRKDGKNLMTQVTELDMSLYSVSESYGTSSPLRTLSDGTRDRRLVTQTQKYRQLFEMFKQKYDEGKLDMVVLWGVSDEDSWLNNSPVRGRIDYPLLFDRRYLPKPAYHELVK